MQTKMLVPIVRSCAAEAHPASRRAGFTLVELLVVVLILAMLMALVVPAVMRARSSAYNAKVKAEIDMLHMALMNYKNEFGSFPPADMRGLWSGSGVNTNHAVYRHLVRVFPRINEPRTVAEQTAAGRPSPYREMSQLSPAQALVFWLRGFYPNQQYPLTNAGQPGTRKKFFDFEESRLYAASLRSLSSPDGPESFKQTFKKRNEVTSSDPESRDYPVFFTPHATSGLPYVYFDSRCYDDESRADRFYGAVSSVGGAFSRAYPYFSSDGFLDTQALWSQKHMSGDSFQLIASGPDGLYGKGDDSRVAFPVGVPRSGSGLATDLPAATAIREHQDNITNFATGSLLYATEALKSE